MRVRSETQKLLNWGYTAFDAVRLFEAGKPVQTVPVWKGASNTVDIGVDGENRVWLGDGDQVLPAQAVREWVALGARLVGGCCGLGPAAVSAISAELAAAH